jgi:hypothetical protein
VAAAAIAGGIDRDPGGYRDTWGDIYGPIGRDKQAHAFAGVSLGALVDAPTGCLAAGVYELAQGTPHQRDFYAGCAGAVLGDVAHRLVRRVTR